jgi:hypothetical protein
MNAISNDEEFRRALGALEPVRQRAVAARFVERVLPLAGDARISTVAQVAARADAVQRELDDALHQARAVVVETHNRCGAECNWRDQAGYFVARAALAAVTPPGQLPGGPAWQAAMSSRMASTCRAIEQQDADAAGSEQQAQYRILSEFMADRRALS